MKSTKIACSYVCMLDADDSNGDTFEVHSLLRIGWVSFIMVLGVPNPSIVEAYPKIQFYAMVKSYGITFQWIEVK